jgi:hypothetical protein
MSYGPGESRYAPSVDPEESSSFASFLGGMAGGVRSGVGLRRKKKPAVKAAPVAARLANPYLDKISGSPPSKEGEEFSDYLSRGF